MGEWKKTGCVLCAQNCGLEVEIENNRIVRVKGDRDNPRSRGYVCRKGVNISYHQHHSDRLTHPLRRTGSGFEKISWDQAIGEIASKLKQIVGEHGPRSYAYMGGGGQGCHFEAAAGVTLMRAIGSRYHYNAIAQELTGQFWAHGRATGKQYKFSIPDEANSEMLIGIGWNGMMSHQMPRAPLVLREFSKDPQKLLVIIDPRRTETAEIADIHLAVRPGADALLFKAMIAIVISEGLTDDDYIRNHVNGFNEIKKWFEGFDAREAIATCELDYEQVRELCRQMRARKTSIHPDLGVYMNRHSTLTCYLIIILSAITGNLCLPGCNVIPGTLMPIVGHSDEREEKTWRTVETGFPALCGLFPPNVMPEEIMSSKPDRLRAVMCCQANPLRSFADTTAYEQAFSNLDLLVVCDVAMTETAAMAHYVLPARTGYESWDGTFFPWTWPEIYFQMRRPVVEPEGEPLELGEIHMRIADSMGFIPEIPQSLYAAAKENRLKFGMELINYVKDNPSAMKVMPFIVMKTLGGEMGSGNLANLWAMLMNAPGGFKKSAVRAGFPKGPLIGEEIFKAIIDHPEGLWIGKSDPDDNFSDLSTEDKKINVLIPEMEEWLAEIEPGREKAALAQDKKYPFILSSGRHMNFNANTIMRDPAWNEGKRACTCIISQEDADNLGLKDGDMIRVTTEAGSVEVEAEITARTRSGYVMIPHGFGLVHQGKTYGVNANLLAKNTHRDRFAGTPFHRHIPCRIEKI
ncbi:MAG TPA: molybdopterin-dependent oxidoreductase [Spirochaetota bacterium]|nr:molybdopterin-dependent oxidoreductase [Spirochaetota bacterium]